jgi:hypothetical protein
MCDGSIASGAPPIALTGNQVVIPTVPRDSLATTLAKGTAAAAPTSPPPPVNPNLGKTLDVTA